MNKLNPVSKGRDFYLMQYFIRLYRLINILSIDVAVGAVACTLFFAKIFDVEVLPFGLISLALTVWIIYTADHLLDAYKIQQPASTERHRFHQQHFKLLLVCLLLAAAVDAIQLIFIRKIVLVEGFALAIVITIYFLLHRYLKFFKEVIGAVLYCGGVLLIPWSLKNDGITIHHLLLIAQFAITALINLFLFSWFGIDQDIKDEHSSFATVMGEQATKYSIAILFFVQGAITLVLLAFGFAILLPAITLFTMNALLFILLTNKKYFEENDRYRLLGDAVFFLPLIYVLI